MRRFGPAWSYTFQACRLTQNTCRSGACSIPSIGLVDHGRLSIDKRVIVTAEITAFEHSSCRSSGSESECLESLCAKQRAGTFDSLRAGGLHIVEHVIEVELFPFESAHLMKWQNVHPFYVPQAGGESRNLTNVLGVVGQTRDQHCICLPMSIGDTQQAMAPSSPSELRMISSLSN